MFYFLIFATLYCQIIIVFFSFDVGKTVSLDSNTNIVVPEDRYGLYAIDVLDPDLVHDVSLWGSTLI